MRQAAPIFNGGIVSRSFRGAEEIRLICTALTAQLGRLCYVVGTILLIVLVIALLGGFSGLGGGPFYGTGYYGGGGLGLILIVVLVLVLLGRL